MSVPVRGMSNQPKQKSPARGGSGCLSFLAMIAVVVFVMAIFGWVSAEQRSRSKDGEIATLKQQVTSLQAKIPQCEAFSSEIEQLQKPLDQRNFALAAELTTLYLQTRVPPECDKVKATFANIAYTAALSDLFNQTGLEGRAALVKYQETERKADANGLPKDGQHRRSPMTIASDAYRMQWWELTRFAILKAWDESADAQSLESIRLYYAASRNLGRELARRGDEQSHQQGCVLLRTADEISTSYGLKQGEAHQDLTELCGSQDKWPLPDANDRMLLAAAKK